MYQNEAHLCEHLSLVARAHGWLVFAETSGFDLLLVATDQAVGFAPGDQIGVEAKLRANVDVLSQAMPRHWDGTPHYYAVLVPEASDAFRHVARALKITVFEGTRLDGERAGDFSFLRWHRYEPTRLCWVPELEIRAMRGGRSGPQQITKWKLSAVRLCLLAEQRGYLTKYDFVLEQINLASFQKRDWLVRVEGDELCGKRIRDYRYRLVLDKKPPHLVYPEIAEALRQEASHALLELPTSGGVENSNDVAEPRSALQAVRGARR